MTRSTIIQRLLFSFQRPGLLSSAPLRSGRELYRNRPELSRPFLPFFLNPTTYSSAPKRALFRRLRENQAPTLSTVVILEKGKNKARLDSEAGLFNKFRRRPTFPHSDPCSIIGAVGLNFCVRDGNRCDPYAIATENRTTGFQLPKTSQYDWCAHTRLVRSIAFSMEGVGARRKPRPDSLTKNFLWSSLTVN